MALQPMNGVNLAMLVDHVVQKSYDNLRILTVKLPGLDSEQRKNEIMAYVAEARGRFLRLLIAIS